MPVSVVDDDRLITSESCQNVSLEIEIRLLTFQRHQIPFLTFSSKSLN